MGRDETKVCNRIRRLRSLAGDLTRQQLADQIGVTHQAVNAVEGAQHIPRRDANHQGPASPSRPPSSSSRSDVGSKIVVTPRIGPSLIGMDDARFAFGGVSIDGGPRSPGAPWTLRFHDLDPDARERAPSPLQPDSRLTFRVPVDLAPGIHRIEARCWIVVGGSNAGKLDPEFDARGDPKFSPEAFVYDLPLVLDVEMP